MQKQVWQRQQIQSHSCQPRLLSQPRLLHQQFLTRRQSRLSLPVSNRTPLPLPHQQQKKLMQLRPHQAGQAGELIPRGSGAARAA